MIDEGADWLDIGGNRPARGAPGAATRSACACAPGPAGAPRGDGLPLSVDTMSPDVGEESLLAGADIINDISACRDPAWMPSSRDGKCRWSGTYERHPSRHAAAAGVSPRATTEVREFFEGRLRDLAAAGVDARRVILDPGLGFGKRVKDNFELIRNIHVLKSLKRPVFIGSSRKSFLRNVVGSEQGFLDFATAVVNTAAVLRGADILRVHNVAHAARMVRLLSALDGSEVAPFEASSLSPDRGMDSARRDREPCAVS